MSVLCPLLFVGCLVSVVVCCIDCYCSLVILLGCVLLLFVVGRCWCFVVVVGCSLLVLVACCVCVACCTLSVDCCLLIVSVWREACYYFGLVFVVARCVLFVVLWGLLFIVVCCWF